MTILVIKGRDPKEATKEANKFGIPIKLWVDTGDDRNYYTSPIPSTDSRLETWERKGSLWEWYDQDEIAELR